MTMRIRLEPAPPPPAASGPQAAAAADSDHAYRSDTAAVGGRPVGGRSGGACRGAAPFPGRTGMTAMPARHRDDGPSEMGAGGTADDGLAGMDRVLDRRARFGWALACIWLIYLAQPATVLWHDADLSRRYAGLALLLAFAAVFVVTFRASRKLRQAGGRLPAVARVSLVSGGAVFAVLNYLTLGETATGLFIYVAVMAVFLFTSRVGWTIVAVILLASLAIPSLVPGWQASVSTTFGIFIAAVAMWGVALLIQRNGQLAAARNEITRLALVAERNRFARDLHDILGHSLTVVAVKAELAGRLAELAPERAAAEIADVERIAREALADVRAAAAGYREVTVAGELASARTALTAAGIEADLPAGLAQVEPGQQEIFGWAIREGVTNVVRHSGATRCSIRVAGDEIEISDDGRGPAGPMFSDGFSEPGFSEPGFSQPGFSQAGTGQGGGPSGAAGAHREWEAGSRGGCSGGQGLAGLRERAAAVGGSVSAGRSAAGGFALRVRVP